MPQHNSDKETPYTRAQTVRSATDRRGAASARATPTVRVETPPAAPARRRSDTFATVKQPILLWS